MGNLSRSRMDYRGVFNCENCGRRCRHVDQPGDDNCSECSELLMMQNGVFDGCPPTDYSPIREKLFKKLKAKKGANMAAVEKSLARLFPEGFPQ